MGSTEKYVYSMVRYVCIVRIESNQIESMHIFVLENGSATHNNTTTSTSTTSNNQ